MSTERSTPATPWPAGATRLCLVLVAAIVVSFLVAEGGVRRMGYALPRWYPQLVDDQAWRGAAHRVVLVGTSRVFAAFDEDAMSAGLSREGTSTRVANMGQGFSNITVHALGLRLLADRGALRGATVVVEAPGGLPEPQDWRAPWVFTERPQWLVSVLRPGDLPALWRSHTNWEDTLGATARTLFGVSVVARYREDVRSAIIAESAALVRNTPPPGTSAPAENIVLPGQRNVEDLARIRDVAVADGQRWLAASRTVSWNDSVVASLVRTVQGAGGHVVFVDMPLSSPMAAGLQGALAQANREAFRTAAARWNTPVLTPQVAFSDDDFPDLWHLSADARARYTQAVLAAWSPGR